MKGRWVLILAGATSLAALIAIPASSSAARGARHFRANLGGSQEVPAVSSTGSGELEMRLNNDRTSIEFELEYEDLEGADTLFAHIHLGQETANGGVIAFFCGGGSKPAPCPDTGGVVTGTIGPSDVIGPAGQGLAAGEFDELVRALLKGIVYANVHTDKHPQGEIRGQVK